MAKFHVVINDHQNTEILVAEVECGLMQNAVKMAMKQLTEEQAAAIKAAGALRIDVVPAQGRLGV